MFLCSDCVFRIGYYRDFKIERRVFVPGRAPSQNDFQGRHWRTYYENIKKNWLNKMALYVKYGNNFAENEGKRFVKIVAYQSSKKSFYDKSNLVGGCKPLIDSLVNLCWLKNDSPKWLVDVYEQIVVPDGCEIGVEIHIFSEAKKENSGKTCFSCSKDASYFCDISRLSNGRGETESEEIPASGTTKENWRW